ncbi:geranylgeranyl reductase-related protein [Syntrophotalea carbinolica DSM 2380]|uniref:Geranylgeranyl reductase-related protein n=1 Tax=Syntrophotalea carbinolica (strain DSM 2380 / NBRC 103641 / GraBd1) TaxID=338963 RepID=Q3A1Y0_SYNC1|nr:NAD(P)/FAD-dependent oxidoreductase [Syntrophotalea carbinolica]ABA89627.1 geranylgeranyl reductase-related protein [Syntrophotalea carbinolica DSM 2380]
MGEDTPSVSATLVDLKQQSIETLPVQTWDVIIAGAGPAGSIAAITLADMGHRVLLTDRDWFPRSKVCGDCLTPGAMRILRRYGLFDAALHAGHRCTQMRIYSPAHVRIDVPGDYLTVKREILDQLLARKALAAGVTFVRGTAAALEKRGDAEIAVRFREGPSMQVARCGLLATGGRLALAQKSGLVAHPVASGAAVRCYVRSRLPIKHMVIACERTILPGYAWIFPVEKDLYNVGCGRFMYRQTEPHLHLKRSFHAFLHTFPIARELMEQGDMETPLKGAVLRSGWQHIGPMASGACLGMGEMVGTTSPYTGEGIGKAMQSGVLAAKLVHRCLRKGDMSELLRYPGYLRLLRGMCYDGFERTRKWFEHPLLVDFLAHRINHSPYLYDRFTAVLQEKNDPAQVFSWCGVLRSLWR